MADARVALITGGSRGLGREIALALASEGWRVAINYLRDEQAAAGALEAAGRGAMLLRADVSRASDVKGMARKVRDGFGRLDALINNASITRDALLVRLSEEDWDEVIATNLKGCFNTIRAFATLMRDSGGGHIVDVSSVSGLRGRAGQAAYSASKAALLALTFTAARELAGYNIRVNAVVPGYMATAMGSASPGAMERAREESELGRLTTPSEVAGFVLWLLGTGYITGQVLRADSRIG